MKKLILFLFVSFTLEAREFSFAERTALINYKKINFVKDHVLSNIVVDELSLGEFLSYKVLKNSCRPLDQKLDEISRAANDYEDQTERLATLISVCSQGVIGLTELKINQSKNK